MGVELKLSYFAWVRERVGKADETLVPPSNVRTIADLIALAFRPRRGIRLRLRAPDAHPRRHRPQAREAGHRD